MIKNLFRCLTFDFCKNNEWLLQHKLVLKFYKIITYEDAAVEFGLVNWISKYAVRLFRLLNRCKHAATYHGRHRLKKHELLS